MTTDFWRYKDADEDLKREIEARKQAIAEAESQLEDTAWWKPTGEYMQTEPQDITGAFQPEAPVGWAMKTREDVLRAAAAATYGGMMQQGALEAGQPVEDLTWPKQLAQWEAAPQPQAPPLWQMAQRAGMTEMMRQGVVSPEEAIPWLTRPYEREEFPIKGAFEQSFDPLTYLPMGGMELPGLAARGAEALGRGALATGRAIPKVARAAAPMAREMAASEVTGFARMLGREAPQVVTRPASLEAMGLAPQFEKRLAAIRAELADIEKKLKVKGRLPGEPTKPLLREERGRLLAEQYLTETISHPSMTNTADMLAEVEKEIGEAYSEMQARAAPYHARMKNNYPGMVTDELAVYLDELDKFKTQVTEQMKAAPPQQAARTAMQTGMGIGEKPPQGQMFPEYGAGTTAGKVPLVDVQAMQAKAVREAEIARGQGAMPLPEAAAKAPKPVPQAAKEPWQMTREELVESARQWRAENMPRLQGRALENELAGVASAHRKMVQRAIEEGKPVPAEVLAEYGLAAPKAAEIPAKPSPVVAAEGVTPAPPQAKPISASQPPVEAPPAPAVAPQAPKAPYVSPMASPEAQQAVIQAQKAARVPPKAPVTAPPGVAVPTAAGAVPPPPSGPGLGDIMGMWKAKQPPSQRLSQALKGLDLALEEKILDKYAGINKMMARVRIAYRRQYGTELPIEMDAELHAALLGGGPQAGVQRAIEAYNTMKQTLGKGINTDFVNTYLHLRHSIDIEAMKGAQRKIAGGVKGAKQAQDLLDTMKTQLGDAAFAKVEAAAGNIRDFYATTLDRKVASGLVSRTLASTLKKQYPWYNPIVYLEKELSSFALGSGGKRMSVTANDLRRLSEFGSEALRERPLDLVARYAVNSEMLIRRNDAARAIMAAAQRDPELVGQVAKVRGTRPVAQVEGETIFRRPSGDIKGTISYLDGGERKLWEVPRWLEREAKYLASLPDIDLERVARVLNAVPRAMLTTYNPAFFAANMLFDALTVATTRGIMPWRVVEALGKNLRALVKEDKVLGDMMKAGASVSGFWGKTPEQAAAEVRRHGQLALHTWGDWKTLLSKPFDTAEKIGHAVEMAPRRAVYEAMIRKGAPAERAALEARRATVDFQRSGTAIRMANSFYLYLNAGLQGTVLPIRALRDIPKAKYGLMGLTGMALAGYAWNRQFPEYKDIPLYDKYGKFIIMLPSEEYDKRGNKVPHYIAVIPVLREFGAMLAPIQYALGKLDGTAPEDLGEFLGAVASLANPFSQIVEGGGVPTYIGQKIFEMAINKDLYRNREIVPAELEGLPVAQQYDEYTSEMARRVGGYLNLSPKMIDFIAENGLGYDIVAGADAALRATSEPVDPRIQGMVEHLKGIQENYPPDMIDRERRNFLATLTPADKEAVLERERVKEPTWPFLEGTRRRFDRKAGGQIYRSGVEAASKQMGLSSDQTRRAGRYLADVAEQMDTMEKELDAKVKDKTITYLQWREGHKTIGGLYRGALLAVAAMYPQAAQVQGKEEWADFKSLVYSLGKAMPDSRSRVELLVAAWRAIPIPETAPGIADWDAYDERVREFEAAISPQDKKALDEELLVGMTDTERDWAKARGMLEPYWGIADKIWARFPKSKARLEEIDRLEATGETAKAKRLRAATPGIAQANRLIRLAREAMRKRSKEIDLAVRKYY